LRAWRSLLNCLLLAAAGIECRGVEPAFAGAWLLAPGEGRAIVYSVFSESSQAYDFQGRLIYEPQYRKFELGTYIEYGVTDWLTVVISPAYDRIRGHPFNPSLPSLKPPPGRSYNGGGESAAAARIRLYQNENNVLSFQAGCKRRAPRLLARSARSSCGERPRSSCAPQQAPAQQSSGRKALSMPKPPTASTPKSQGNGDLI
jgi:hypothetical protein